MLDNFEFMLAHFGFRWGDDSHDGIMMGHLWSSLEFLGHPWLSLGFMGPHGGLLGSQWEPPWAHKLFRGELNPEGGDPGETHPYRQMLFRIKTQT